VSLTFALRFKKDISKSPNCEVREIIIVNKTIVKKLCVSRCLKNKGIKNNENIKEPIEPDIVLFGLIFVNFFPLKNFPNTIPPMSDIIATDNEKIKMTNKSVFIVFTAIIKKTTPDKYSNEDALYTNLKILFLMSSFLNILEIRA
jgi:hypothetical protein